MRQDRCRGGAGLSGSGTCSSAALTLIPWLGLAVVVLLLVVVASYRQTCYAYPNGGGAFVVSKDNLGSPRRAEHGPARQPGRPMTRVLVVDDDPQILRALKINLAARGYTVLTAPDGTRALHFAAHDHPDVIVLDLGLPDLDGTDVITGLRGWSTTPIIVLSARIDSDDKVEPLDAGADDYVTKPFGMDELLARLRAAVRRATTQPTGDEAVVHAGALDIDLAAKQVTRDGVAVHLTRLPSSPPDHRIRHGLPLYALTPRWTAVWMQTAVF
jgi:CheY-like chemotaxis protein